MANEQLKHSILAEDDLPVGQVETPEWKSNPTTYIRSLSALEFVMARDMQGDKNIQGRFAALVICDSEGSRLFTDDDAEALGGKARVVLERIMDAALSHNGVGEDEQEETAKN